MRFSFRKRPLAGLFVLALTVPTLAAAAGASTTTRTVGPQPNGTIVASDNTLLTPAGTIVNLGSPVVAKAVALNPRANATTGAVMMMDAAQPIIIFNTVTGAVLQRYAPDSVTNGVYSTNTT